MAIVLSLALMLTVFAGCKGNDKADAPKADTPATDAPVEEKPASSDGIDVGIVLPTKDEPRWLQDQERFESVIKDAGYTTEVLFSQGDPNAERANVDALIAKNIKVLIICAHDAAAAAAAVEEAKANDITVIAYDRLITDTDAVDYYVTFDSVAVGAAMGQYLADQAGDGKGLPLYLFAGAATDNNAFLFFQGAWNILQPKIADGTFNIVNSSEAEALKDTKDLSREQQSTIIGQITTDWDFNIAKSKAEANLTAASADQKGECFVLAPNDGTSRSIADAFEADADVSKIYITGQDAELASIQYIIDGKQSMTVFKDTRVLAKDAMDMAVEIIEGKTPATDSTYDNGVIDVPSKQSPIDIVTQDNVKAILIDSGYYDADKFTGLD